MRLAWSAIVVCCFALPASAQSITTGAIRGVVTDEASGAPLAGVIITATAHGRADTQSAISDVDGSYQIGELLPGAYDLTFVLDRTTATHTGIDVAVDRTTTLYQKLRIGDVIHVVGTPPPIDVTNGTHHARVDRGYLENVPIPGTDFTAALGAVGGSQNDGVGIAFSGSTSLENRYIVDGIDITGLTFGDVGTPVPNEFIQEMDVVTGGYNAEWGRATGGIVNIITRSGSDELRGSVFGVYQPGWLTRRALTTPVNASSIDITPNRAYTGDFGFELGGPLVPGRAWFYVGAVPHLQATDYTRTTKSMTDCHKPNGDGTLSTCQRQYADGVPDVDPKTGFYVTDTLDSEVRRASTRSLSAIAKLDVAASESQRGQVSLIAIPSDSTTPGLLGLPTSGRRTSGLTTDSAARWTSRLDDGATEVEALVAWHRSTLDSGSIDPRLDAQPLQILQDGNLGTWSALGGESQRTALGCADGGAGDKYPFITNCPMTSLGYAIGGPGPLQHDREDRRSARVSATERVRAVGSHEIKAGVDIEDDTKSIARVYSGGAVITNDVAGDTVRVQRWAQIAPPGGGTGFDETCTTPDPNGGGAMKGSKAYACRFLGGSIGAPGTQLDGQTINWAAYLRDSWQPVPSVTLNMGLRYEEQRLYYARSLRNTIDPLTLAHLGETAMNLTGNWAPRLGAVWDPTREGRAKLYAQWGRFYESIPMDINDRSFGGEVSDTRTYSTKGGTCGPSDPRIGGPDGAGCLGAGKPDSEQLVGASGVLVAPGIRAEYMDELLAGAEVAVIPNLVFGVTFQHRTLGRIIEDVSTDGANTYIIANPGETTWRGITMFDRPQRDYNALELTIGRRFAAGLFLQGSYTYSRAEGNYPGSVSYDNGQIDPNISSQYDLIELLANHNGPLPQDRPHSFKLDGYYGFDAAGGHITIGARGRAISGIPENALGAHYLYGPNESFLLPRGELGRTDFEHAIDVHVGYRRALSHGMTAELFADVFNIYDRQAAFTVDDTYAPAVRPGGAGSAGALNNVNPISGGTYDDLVWAKTITAQGVETNVPTARNPNFHHATSRYAPTSAQVGFRVTF
jgi:outer membrane receptor protein involved in Fe transport